MLICRDLIARRYTMQKLRNSIRPKSQTGVQLWKTWRVMCGLEKILRRISRFLPKRA
jgi:hypothetical protein